MKITVNQIREKAIIAGIEPSLTGKIEMDVDLSELSISQRECLASGVPLWVVRGELQEVIDALQEVVDRSNEDALKARNEKEVIASWITELIKKGISSRIRKEHAFSSGVRYYEFFFSKISMWSNEVFPVGGKQYGGSYQRDDVIEFNILGQLEADRLNGESLASVADQIFSAKKAIAEKNVADEASAIAAKTTMLANRLESGKVEIHMPRGSRKDWGEPWIAKVGSSNGRRPEYNFAEGRYDLASETLSIPCKPGEVIAYGQKNYKKDSRTIHETRIMRVNGDLVKN